MKKSRKPNKYARGFAVSAKSSTRLRAERQGRRIRREYIRQLLAECQKQEMSV
jgi:hypothetical protein